MVFGIKKHAIWLFVAAILLAAAFALAYKNIAEDTDMLPLTKALTDIETSRGSGLVSFQMQKNKPYYRISITNDNPAEILTVQLTYQDEDGTPIWSKKVSSDTPVSVTDKAGSSGSYYISVASNPHGETLSGSISVHAASDQDLLS